MPRYQVQANVGENGRWWEAAREDQDLPPEVECLVHGFGENDVLIVGGGTAFRIDMWASHLLGWRGVNEANPHPLMIEKVKEDD